MNPIRLLPLLALSCAIATGTAWGQAFPARPIRFVVPFPPGSALDIMARLVAQKMTDTGPQPVIVDNRAGANGTIGSDHVAKAAPDGYTLLATTTSTHVAAAALVKKLPYDPRRDVTPITAAVDAVVVLAVNPSVPAQTPAELVAHLKRSPGKYSYSSPGVGNAFHLIGEMFQATQGVQLLHVPYKGAVQAVQAAASGETQIAFSAVSSVLPQMKAGKLRALAVLNPQRYAGLPDVPTSAETLPGFVRPDGWFGFLGPPGLPAPVLRRLNGDIVSSLKSPDVRGKLEGMGLALIANSPEEFQKMYLEGFEVYARIVKTAGIEPE